MPDVHGFETMNYHTRYYEMGKKPPPEDDLEDKSRTEQARQVAEEYAKDQREIIKKLRKSPN